MIVFDLRCANDHRFEAWFGSTPDYENQQARGLLSCPVCDNRDVAKAVMAPAVPAKANKQDAGHLARQLRALKAEVEARCDDVGPRFAEEARRRADAADRGKPERGCFGQATLAEAAALADDGIPIAPLPFRPSSMTDA